MQRTTQRTMAFRLTLALILTLTLVAIGLHGWGDGLVSPSAARAATDPVDAKIEIVWPHDSAPVTAAALANIEVYLFQSGTLTPVGQEFDNPVRLWKALNNNPASPVSTGQKTIVTRDGVTFPIWIFNDVDVSAAQDPANKIYFFARVDGVDSRHNVWTHGADPRTFFPQQDRPQAGTSQ
ncbi:MAG: hypothetical protein EPO21_07860 [Chloroflexota bacterium]|nr:MAG: hypothetical protein EPO21_07860 [Chloroflexota bacterium]